MNSIAHFSIKRSVTTSLIIIAMIVSGIICIFNMKTQLLPSFNIPMAMINIQWIGASPEDVDKLITDEIQDGIKSLEGIDDITGTSGPGSSTVTIKFKYGINIDEKIREIQSKINNIKGNLPDDIEEPTVKKMDPNASPIITYNISGKDLSDLYLIADNQIKPVLEKISGISEVAISGGEEEEIRIELNPEKLNSYGLNINDLKGIILASNINIPLGNIKSGEKEFRVKIRGEIESFEQVEAIVISNKDGKKLRLSDIANIIYTHKDIDSIARDNGKKSLRLEIKKSDDGNTIEIISAVKEVMVDIENSVSNKIIFTVAQDDSVQINNSINTVSSNAFQGIILAAIVLLLFLKNIRATLIISVALPTSVIVSFAFLYMQGISLNIISLMGLALGVGMLVDNSIVVIDNIYRRMSEHNEDRSTASANGASEMTIPIITSTLTTVAVFLPIVIKQGMAREVFHDMSFSIAYSLTASIIVALTFIPMAASKFLNSKSTKSKDGKMLKTLKKIYGDLLEIALKNKIKTIVIVISLFLLTGITAFKTMRTEFMPVMDTGQYVINGTLAKGLDITKTDNIAKEIEYIVKNDKFTKNYYSSIEADSIEINVNTPLKNERKESLDEIISLIRKKIKNIPDVKLVVSKKDMGGNSGSNGDLELKIYGNNSKTLQVFSEKIIEELKKEKGLIDIKSSNQGGNPEIVIDIDREKAKYYGLDISTIAELISIQVKGTEIFSIKTGESEIDVTLRLDDEHRKDISDISNIYINTTYGKLKLSEIASLNILEGTSTIEKENGKNVISIYSSLDGVDLGTGTELIKKIMNSQSIPKSVTYSFGGNQKQFQEVISDLIIALIAAVFLIYFILAAQFESYTVPFIIMLSIPLALIGAFLGFIITGIKFNIMAMVGIIMLVGIVVNNAIVLIDYTVSLREKGNSIYDALRIAVQTRIRPIFMTTATTACGMIPLAIGLGQGSEYYQGMAIVVIFGLSFSTFLTLIVIPVLYVLEERVRSKLLTLFKIKKESDAYLESKQRSGKNV